MTQVIGLGLFAKENDEENGGYITNGDDKVLGTIGREQNRRYVLSEVTGNMPAANLRVIADFLDKLNSEEDAFDRLQELIRVAVEKEATNRAKLSAK